MLKNHHRDKLDQQAMNFSEYDSPDATDAQQKFKFDGWEAGPARELYSHEFEFHGFDREVSMSQFHRQVIISGLSARGLKKMDILSKSDPYCTVQVIDPFHNPVLEGDEVWKTHTVNNSCDPDWLESYELNFPGPHSYAGYQLLITIWDEDIGGAAEYMGEVLINLRTVQPDTTPQRFTFELALGADRFVSHGVRGTLSCYLSVGQIFDLPPGGARGNTWTLGYNAGGEEEDDEETETYEEVDNEGQQEMIAQAVVLEADFEAGVEPEAPVARQPRGSMPAAIAQHIAQASGFQQAQPGGVQNSAGYDSEEDSGMGPEMVMDFEVDDDEEDNALAEVF
jgi:hypothetical protein